MNLSRLNQHKLSQNRSNLMLFSHSNKYGIMVEVNLYLFQAVKIQQASVLSSKYGRRRTFCAAIWMRLSTSTLCWDLFSLSTFQTSSRSVTKNCLLMMTLVSRRLLEMTTEDIAKKQAVIRDPLFSLSCFLFILNMRVSKREY